MNKLDRIECEIHQKLTPLEAIEILHRKVHGLDKKVVELEQDSDKHHYTFYSSSFNGVGSYGNIFKNKECNTPTTYAELLRVCENYDAIQVVNGATVYRAIGYRVKGNAVTLFFPYAWWYETSESGGKTLVSGFPSISVYKDSKGNSYEYYNMTNSVPD